MLASLNVSDQHECLLVEIKIWPKLGQLEVVPEPWRHVGTVEPFRFEAIDEGCKEDYLQGYVRHLVEDEFASHENKVSLGEHGQERYTLLEIFKIGTELPQNILFLYGSLLV